MFMSKKRFVSLVLILSLVIMSDQVSMAKDKSGGTSLVYTAIGDAIALGVGGEYNSVSDPLKGYDDYLVENLKDKYPQDDIILHNVAGRRDTSSDLLNKLMYDETVISAVANADIITVSVGANNLILPVWPIFEQIFSGVISPEEGVYEIFGKTAEFQAGVNQFKQDWPKIVEQLKVLSPNAQIFATTMYNPFTLDNPLYNLADAYINQINAEIQDKSFQHDYKVADVYSDFYKYESKAYKKGYDKNYTPLIHQDLPDVVHPTPLGYQRICDLIKIKKIK
jgi:lysophospholipase L1-like esterase